MSSPTQSHGSMSKLMIGFALSIMLTAIPFALVMGGIDVSPTTAVGVIMGFAAIQIIVHLVFFLHVNGKSEGGWTIAATFLAVIIVFIVIAGSLWVMHNMNVNMMPMPDMSKMMDLQAQRG